MKRPGPKDGDPQGTPHFHRWASEMQQIYSGGTFVSRAAKESLLFVYVG